MLEILEDHENHLDENDYVVCDEFGNIAWKMHAFKNSGHDFGIRSRCTAVRLPNESIKVNLCV